MRISIIVSSLLLATTAFAGFTLDDDGKALTILEEGKPVLTYQYGIVDPPGRLINEKFRRGSYIHPLYGLDGEIMTQDFPIDHFHHRGVFWAWPNSSVGDRPIDIWLMDGVRQHHEEWVTREASEERAEIAVTNIWSFDDDPDTPQMREHVRFIIHPADDTARAIDFDLRFENVSGEVFEIHGATTDDKGYGGFCFRPDARRRPLTFTAAQGKLDDDVLRLDTPWMDCSFEIEKDKPEISGAAIFQHPGNPGYPHPGWIARHYGFLGVSWPHTEPHTLEPGESFHLRYRLYLHRGNAEDGKVRKAFEKYTQSITP